MRKTYLISILFLVAFVLSINYVFAGCINATGFDHICGMTINSSCTMNESVNSTGTCFTIGANDIILDGNGSTISYSINAAGYGITAGSVSNITIENFNIVQSNASITSAHGINFGSVVSSFLINNNVTTSGTSSNGVTLAVTSSDNIINANNINGTEYGVFVSSGINNQITNNIIKGVSYGVRLQDSSNILSGNTIYSTGTAGGISDDSSFNTINGNTIVVAGIGVDLTSSSSNTTVQNNIVNSTISNALQVQSGDNNLTNNTVRALGSGGSGITVSSFGNRLINNTAYTLDTDAISIASSGHTLISNNAFVTGASSSAAGLHLTSGANSNIITDITARASAGSPIFLDGASLNTFSTVSASTDTGKAIYLDWESGPVYSENNTFNGVTIRSNNTWIETSFAGGNNFTANTFMTDNGSIFFYGTFSMSDIMDLKTTKLNISANNAFVNSTELPFLNTTAQITLNGISFTNPQATVDAEDDGSFIACNSPQCVEESYIGSTFIYNVTRFTSYSSQETVNVLSVTNPITIYPIGQSAVGSGAQQTIFFNATINGTNIVNVTFIHNSACIGQSDPALLFNISSPNEGIYTGTCTVNTSVTGEGNEQFIINATDILNNSNTSVNFSFSVDLTNPTFTSSVFVAEADQFYSSASGNNIINLRVNASDSGSGIRLVEANFTYISSCGGTPAVNMTYNSSSGYYQASCNVSADAATSDFVSGSVIVTAYDNATQMDNSTFFPIILYNMTIPPMDPASCIQWGIDTTDLSIVQDFEDVNFVLDARINLSCYI